MPLVLQPPSAATISGMKTPVVYASFAGAALASDDCADVIHRVSYSR
jgi:hypothetical protein